MPSLVAYQGDRFDHAAELDHRSVACAFDEPPVRDRDRGVDEVAPAAPRSRASVSIRDGRRRDREGLRNGRYGALSHRSGIKADRPLRVCAV